MKRMASAAELPDPPSNKTYTQPRQNRGKRRMRREDDEQNSAEEETGSMSKEKSMQKFVYHYEIFDRLVSAASNDGALHYDYEEPAHGLNARDVTAYKASQATWARALAHRPANLCLWQAPASRKSPTNAIGTMKFNGKTVLDYTGKPIRTFDIPWAISSAVEGYRVESWLRADKRIKMADIVARIYTQRKGSKRVPIWDARTLATRMKRFREEAGLVSWGAQHVTPEAIAFLKSLRSDAQRLHNLTVQRDLTFAERANYHWITMEKDVDLNNSSAAGRIKRVKITGQHARGNFPAGEFAPGAQDAGDLFEESNSGSDDDSELSTGDPPEDDDAGPSFRESGLIFTLRSVRDAANGKIVPGAGEAYASNEDEEAQDLDYNPNVEVWQVSSFMNSAVASHAHNEKAIDNNDALLEFSLCSELEDPTDSRNEGPKTEEEAQMLQSALAQTIADFQELSGGRIPDKTEPTENYLSQWAALQMQYSIFWTGVWNNYNAPTLRGLGPWTGGIANWQTAARAGSDRVIAEEEARAM